MVVSILGCGWLGTALGKHLLADYVEVKGSATSAEKVKALKTIGINSFLVKVSGTDVLDIESDFWNCNALIIASNVNLQGNPGYIAGLRAVAEMVALRKIQRVIVVSSTSIYGEPNDFVDENSTPCPKTASARCLLEIEGIFQKIKNTQTTMMRCGGLVGTGRMPGSFLAGKQDVPNGSAPVNLVHLSDCIGIIASLLNSNEIVACINAVAQDHPSRAEFYTTAARVQRLTKPEFILEKTAWKIVSSKVTSQLGYKYVVNNWIDWLRSAQ